MLRYRGTVETIVPLHRTPRLPPRQPLRRLLHDRLRPGSPPPLPAPRRAPRVTAAPVVVVGEAGARYPTAGCDVVVLRRAVARGRTRFGPGRWAVGAGRPLCPGEGGVRAGGGGGDGAGG